MSIISRGFFFLVLPALAGEQPPATQSMAPEKECFSKNLSDKLKLVVTCRVQETPKLPPLRWGESGFIIRHLFVETYRLHIEETGMPPQVANWLAQHPRPTARPDRKENSFRFFDALLADGDLYLLYASAHRVTCETLRFDVNGGWTSISKHELGWAMFGVGSAHLAPDTRGARVFVSANNGREAEWNIVGPKLQVITPLEREVKTESGKCEVRHPGEVRHP